jgi:hypothetical protein
MRPGFVLSSPQVSVGGVDLTGFVKEAGFELDPWQAEVLERGIEERPYGFPERHKWRMEFRARRNGKTAGFRDLFGPFLDEAPAPMASWRHPWSVQTWQARRAAGLGPQRVEVHQGRVDIVFAVVVSWGPRS